MIDQLVANENSENNGITREERRLMGERMVAQLINTSQREAFDQIMLSINTPTNLIRPCTFFIDGPGDPGKTFLYNTQINVLEGQGKKVISVASTGIASTLLTNGALSQFQIYPPITDTTTSRIEEHSYSAKLIREASLIIHNDVKIRSKGNRKDTKESYDKTTYPTETKFFYWEGIFVSVYRSSSMATESKWLKRRSRLTLAPFPPT